MEHHAYAGLKFHQDLSLKHHTSQTISKAQHNLNLQQRDLSGCSENTKEHTYDTLICPVLEYASSTLDPYQASQINTLEPVQRNVARVVMQFVYNIP